MDTLVHKVRGDRAPEEFMAMPLPITQKIEIVLVYSEQERFVIVALEPDLAFERLSQDQKLALSPHGATNCYHFAYTTNRYVGDAVETLQRRVGRWEFIPGHGLILEADTDAAHEVQSVMDDALYAIHQLAPGLDHDRTETVH